MWQQCKSQIKQIKCLRPVNTSRLPRQVLYGQLKNSKGPGGPKKRFKGQAKTTLQKCKIPPSWKSLQTNKICNRCHFALEEDCTARQTLQRQRRYVHSRDLLPAEPQLMCQACGEACRSRQVSQATPRRMRGVFDSSVKFVLTVESMERG